MPVSPELAAELARQTLTIYTDAEEQLLARIARRLARGIDEPGWADRKLLELQQIRREIQAVVTGLDRSSSSAITEAIATAYNRGAATAGTDLQRMLKLPRSEAFAPVPSRAVELLASEAVQTVQASHLRILRSSLDVYRSVVAQSAPTILTGAVTRRQAAQLVLDRFADRGVTGFIDRAGRSWDLASYAEMSTRTASGRAAVSGHVDRLVDAGHDLVVVSDAPEECKLCRPWEGEILSISGNDPEYPSLSDAESDGLFHAGCRHATSIYVPGLTRRPTGTHDPVGDRNRQQQRYLERGVRQYKRRAAAALDDTARKASEAKASEWRARLDQHVKSNDMKRLRYRESIGAR